MDCLNILAGQIKQLKMITSIVLMNKYANETKEVREIVNAIITSIGGKKKFAKKIGMSHDSLKGKLTRRRLTTGGVQKLTKEEWEKIYFVLMDEKEEWDWEYSLIANRNKDKPDEYIGDLIEKYHKQKKELELEL